MANKKSTFNVKFLFNIWLEKLLLLIIFSYRYAISPLIPARCRFYPTCSSYGIEAIRLHGGMKGAWLIVKRICRCHPWGGSGIDFVPLPLYRYQYYFVKNLPSGWSVFL